MVAIITDKIKQQLIASIFADIQDSAAARGRYYIGISRAEQWNDSDIASVPANSNREERLFRYSLQSVKAVEAYSYVVPRKNWVSNTTYKAYDDNVDKISDPQSYSYYVINQTNDVYVCVRQGVDANGLPTPSIFEPTSRTIQVERKNDGYVWKYLYTISTADATNFLSANFMPVKYVDTAISTDPYYSQFLVKEAAAARPKQILGFKVVNGGSGYTLSNVNTINSGNQIVVRGTSTRTAKAQLVRNSSNVITSVQLQDSGTSGGANDGLATGAGYNNATVVIPAPTTGTTATAIPIFGPPRGLGFNPVIDLQATAIMFNIRPNDNVDGNFIVGNDYRQIGLIRSPLIADSAAAFTATSGRALKQLKLPSATSATFTNDAIISADSASGYVDYFDATNKLVWYHQTEATGFVPFVQNKTLTGGSVSVNIDSARPAQVDPLSGEILYIDNRSVAIQRTAGQTEDIKIVIQL
jgi:hypothetical protein